MTKTSLPEPKKAQPEIDWDYYEELAANSRKEQGLSEKVTDPVTLNRIATLYAPTD